MVVATLDRHSDISSTSDVQVSSWGGCHHVTHCDNMHINVSSLIVLQRSFMAEEKLQKKGNQRGEASLVARGTKTGPPRKRQP